MSTFLTIGLRGFTARNSIEGGQPNTLPYAKNPLTSGIKAGHPLILTSAGTGGWDVSRATLSGLYVNSSRLLGFAANPEHGTINAAYGGIGIPIPPVRGMNDIATMGQEQVEVYVTDTQTIFQACLRSGILADPGLVGQRAALYLEDPSQEIYSLDTGAPQYENVVITAINPSDVGKNSGRVDFKVVATVAQYPDPN